MDFRERLASSSREHKSRVVLALDLAGPPEARPERAEALLKAVGDQVAGVKVNFQLLLPRGLEGIRGVSSICREKGLPLIADIKLNDIESTNLEAVELLFGAGFDAVIANPFVGYEEGLRGVFARARELSKGVILLVYMSHAGAKEGYGLRAGSEPLYVRFSERARRWKADGVVVSSKSPTVIRAVRRMLTKDQLILSPGVGAQGGDAKEAVKAGSDYAIVGRSVIEARDPAAELRRLNRVIPAP